MLPQPDRKGASLLADLRRWHAGGGWLPLLLLVPAVAVVAFLASLLVAVFVSLFVVLGLGFAFRLWWFRRKLRSRNEGRSIDGEYLVIDERTTVIRPPRPGPNSRGIR